VVGASAAGFPAGVGNPAGGFGVRPVFVVLFVFVALIVILVVAAWMALSRMRTASSSGGGARSGETPPASLSYSIGQIAPTGGFEVTAYALEDPLQPTTGSSQPAAGMRRVSVQVQITNPSSSSRLFSSQRAFDLLDSEGHRYTRSVTTGVAPGPPDGEIPAGQSIRGSVVFEVPMTSTGLVFRVQGDPTAASVSFTPS